MLSPKGPKGKLGSSEVKESGPAITEADVLSPIRLKEKESSPSRLCKKVVRGKIKSMAREKGKAQSVEESEQA